DVDMHRLAAAIAELVCRALRPCHLEIADMHEAFENVVQQDIHNQMSPQTDHPATGLECWIKSTAAHRPRPIDAPRCNVHQDIGVRKVPFGTKKPGSETRALVQNNLETLPTGGLPRRHA